MYLSKAQVDGLRDIETGRVTVIRPELVAFYLSHGLLVQELFGWQYSEKAKQWLEETRRENEQLKVDFSGNKYATGKREAFSSSDGAIVERKHKNPFSGARRIETKYKEIK
jgi:hypothetical protein